MDSFNLAKIVSNYSTNVASLLCVVSIPHSLRPQKLWFYFLFIQGSDFIFPMPSTLFVQVHTLTTKFHNFLTNWFPSFWTKQVFYIQTWGQGHLQRFDVEKHRRARKYENEERNEEEETAL